MLLKPERRINEVNPEYTVLTEDVTPVLTLSEAKEFMLIDFPDFDDLIEQIIIPGAKEAIETYTGYTIGAKTIQLIGDYTAEGVYYPFAPFGTPDASGVQNVGYTVATLPADIKLAWLNLVHIVFNNRAEGLDFVKPLSNIRLRRRRVGI